MSPSPPAAEAPPGSCRLDRPLAFAAWGIFLIWCAAAIHGGLGAGSILLGAGVVILVHQGVRKSLHCRPDGRLLLAGLVLMVAGLWRMIGAEVRILPLFLLAGGITLLVISWKEFSRRE